MSDKKPEDIEYTPEEFKQFKRLVVLGESHRQMKRIASRLEMPKFVARVGKAKCDAMFEVLKREKW